jgi:hypothetical protein
MLTRDERIQILENDHQKLLNDMMDNVIDSCITTISDGIFMLDTEGETTVGAEYLLSLIERIHHKNNELSSSMIKLVNVI